ncbi:MAG: di-heme oxidoredictase family protein [Polyangiaceae bacterium]
MPYAPIYTDLLLHDMGDSLADSIVGANQGEAQPRDWRTAPLIGLRFSASYLHDRRAKTIAYVILMHDGPGSEVSDSRHLIQALSATDQHTLVDFVSGL